MRSTILVLQVFSPKLKATAKGSFNCKKTMVINERLSHHRLPIKQMLMCKIKQMLILELSIRFMDLSMTIMPKAGLLFFAVFLPHLSLFEAAPLVNITLLYQNPSHLDPFKRKMIDDHMVHDWRGGEGKRETLKSSVAKDNDASKMVYLGGMRHPARVVRSMASAQTLGARIGGAWDFMIGKHPEILEMAGRYGADLEALPKGLVAEWKKHPQGDRGCRRRTPNRAQGEVRVPVHPRC